MYAENLQQQEQKQICLRYVIITTNIVNVRVGLNYRETSLKAKSSGQSKLAKAASDPRIITFSLGWFVCLVTADYVAKWIDGLLWFAMLMSGIALQLLLLLRITSLHLLRHQQLVIGLGASCFHASAGIIGSCCRHAFNVTQSNKPRYFSWLLPMASL